ncbi:MAG: precorrin-6x reductase [Clostridia bacterium BRH_c25]|nr:MAG: precorrin-6x reductase [Clostridia bacterium BRH_c25]
MIWVIGGTSEAKKLISLLRGKKEFVATVATYSGAEMLQDRQVIVGRMSYSEMVQFIKDKSIDTVVDMSHPYALEVTQNAKTASEETGAAYIRFVRRSSDMEACIFVESVERCVSYLESVEGCVLFTTGIKNIKDFEKARGTNRFVYRVLPSIFSIQQCVQCSIRMEDIIAILGPVSEDMNYQMFKEYNADYVVMKDSGKEGGTLEKINACKRLGITPVVILRQCEEKGIEDMDELIKALRGSWQ